MKLVLPFTLAAALMASHGVAAWGDLGQETVGYVAMQFLDPTALFYVQALLGPTFNESLGPAAIWADQVKSQEEFAFTRPFHFINADDDPPDSCSVDLDRDCGPAGCIVTAIQNYTTQLLNLNQDQDQDQDQSPDDLSPTQQALLFITSFIADIGQPLNDEAKERGGNDIETTCDGASTNLHELWDTGMVTKNVNDLYGGSAENYASYLVAQIQSGEYASEAPEWISDINQDALTGTDVPLSWAQEANAYDCSVVFKDLNPDEDLCETPYYDNATPVIDLQIARQGYRLAIWLNTIFG